MPTSPVLLLGAPALASPLKAAGVVVLPEGLPDRDYAVVVGRLTSDAVPVVQAQIAQGRTVLLLASPDEDASSPPPNVRVMRLPVVMDDLLGAIGAEAVGGVVGTAEIGIDLSVRPTKARDALGLFHDRANGAKQAGQGAAHTNGAPVLTDSSTRRGPEPLAVEEMEPRLEPAVAKVPGPWDLRRPAPLPGTQPLAAQPPAGQRAAEAQAVVVPSLDPLSVYDDLAPASKAMTADGLGPSEALAPTTVKQPQFGQGSPASRGGFADPGSPTTEPGLQAPLAAQRQPRFGQGTHAYQSALGGTRNPAGAAAAPQGAAAGLFQSPGARRLGSLIICFAGKGGVGKSSLALALGEQASSLGLRSIVVDANRGQGDLRKYLRVNQAYLPSVVDAATSGDPTRAITTPERLAAARPAGLPVPSFATVLAPTDAQVDPTLVTPEVYREVVEAVRELADIVIVDTQIVEATDIGGMVDDFMVPELLSGAWGLGISDPSVGADNLLRRIYMLSARGVGPARLMVCLNRVEPSSGLNQEAMARLVEPYAAWMGAVGIDPRITTAFESGGIPTSPALEELLGRVLARVTGITPVAKAEPAEDKPSKKKLFRWKK